MTLVFILSSNPVLRVFIQLYFVPIKINKALPLRGHIRFYANLDFVMVSEHQVLTSLSSIDDYNLSSIFLYDALHVPSLSRNLLSIGLLIDNNCSVLFSCDGCFIKDKATRKQIWKGHRSERVFTLDLMPQQSSFPSFISSFHSDLLSSFEVSDNNDLFLWHCKLGHTNVNKLKFWFFWN